MCAGMTTFKPLYEYAKKGERVAVLGVGGLGHFALQWAQKMGCEVHCFSSSHKKDELTKRLGSTKTVVWTKGEHLKL
jgi:alcohol dehydrogenase (NADP+)